MEAKAIERVTGSRDGSVDLSKSDIFDLLRNQRRRFVVYYLQDHGDDSVELGTLATQIAVWENTVPAGEVSADQRKRVYTALQQTHLPRMDDAGIIEFDSSRGTIRATDSLTDLTIYLEVVPGNEFAWYEYYLALGAVCTALMVAVWANIDPFTALPPSAWGVLVSTVVILSATVHGLSQRDRDVKAGAVPPETAESEREN